MKVLAACEFSGVVREAFRALGHDAWSCDLFPTEKPSRYHIQDEVLRHVKSRWEEGGPSQPYDLIIAFTPCTYSCNSGVRWLVPNGVMNEERYQRMKEACDLFGALYQSCDRIGMENPIMHRYAREYLAKKWGIPAPTQIIQPWMFGHGETKATCLWLKNLPPLVPTKIVSGREARVHRMPPGPDRWKERSRTFTGIAEAMAMQWGGELRKAA